MSDPSTLKIRRVIGDVHGIYNRYKAILKETPYPTIQVGDMGVGFSKPYIGGAIAHRPNPPYDLMVEGDHKFIRGNHDNPSVCRKHTQYIEDGTIIGNTMFIGGALSIDKAYRYQGYDYWDDEELSHTELEICLEKFEAAKPEIMITHECPNSISNCFADTYGIKLDPKYASRTRTWFETMFGIHQPKLWVFGHWHNKLDYVNNGTRFICLPELETIDVDFEKVEVLDEPSK